MRSFYFGSTHLIPVLNIKCLSRRENTRRAKALNSLNRNYRIAIQSRDIGLTADEIFKA